MQHFCQSHYENSVLQRHDGSHDPKDWWCRVHKMGSKSSLFECVQDLAEVHSTVHSTRERLSKPSRFKQKIDSQKSQTSKYSQPTKNTTCRPKFRNGISSSNYRTFLQLLVRVAISQSLVIFSHLAPAARRQVTWFAMETMAIKPSMLVQILSSWPRVAQVENLKELGWITLW